VKCNASVIEGLAPVMKLMTGAMKLMTRDRKLMTGIMPASAGRRRLRVAHDRVQRPQCALGLAAVPGRERR
jgi:hypothetical protein